MCAIKDNVLNEKEFAMKELLETSEPENEVEEEVTEPWQDRPEYDENGLPNE